MGKYVPTPEQQDVIDARHSNCLVSAAAGSGKTSVLVDRIMGLITDKDNPIDIDELIVVTFTNAAAAEMKDRIQKALDDLVEEKGDDPHIAKQSGLIENAMITTIDGFCNRFLREHFYLLPYEPNFRILDPGEAILIENDILDVTLNEFYEAADPVFFEFLSDYASERDDAKIADMITALYKTAISSPFPEKFLAECIEAYSEDKVDSVEKLPFYGFIKSEYDIAVEEGIRKIEEAAEIIKGTPGLENGIDNYDSAVYDINALSGATSYEDCHRRLANKKKPAMYGYRGLDPELAEIKEKARSLRISAYAGIESIGALFKDDAKTILEEYKAIKPYVEILVNITSRYIENLEKEKIKRNVMSFSDLSHYALKILYDENNEVSEVAREYGKRFKEIMIDEYQDSNYMQEYIMSALSDPTCKESDLFMVGDVKQSIYRFRQAVPQLFIDKYDRYSKDTEAKERKLLLTANFRSREEVTGYANGVFDSIMHKDLGGIEYDDNAALVSKASYEEVQCDNRTELIVVEDSKDEDDRFMLEISAIAARIKRLLKEQQITDSVTKKLRPARLSDIVILTRAGTENDSIIDGLNKFGIPAISQQGTGYFETVEVTTILSLLSLIDNSRREIEIAAILVSPIIGLEHADLAQIKIMQGKGFEDKIREYIKSGESEHIKAKLTEFTELIKKLKSYAAFMNVHSLIRKIYEITDYETYVMFMEGGELRQRNLIMLIEMAKNFESTSYKGLSQFIRYIEKMKKYEVDTQKAQSIDAGNAVTLMTMHKSKGLEFPIVIIARTGKEFGGSKKKPLIQTDVNNYIGLYRYDGIKRTRKTSYAYTCITYKDKLDEHAEELRVLYVALTRAKEKLIITGMSKDYESLYNSSLSKLDENGRMSHADKISAKSFLEYLMPATIAMADDNKAILKFCPISGNSCDDTGIPAEEEAAIREISDVGTVIDSIINNVDETRIDELKALYDKPYHHEAALLLKNKMSVSEIKHKFMDEELKADDEAYQPDFLKSKENTIVPAFMGGEKEENGGALYGTAVHRVMELIPFEDDAMLNADEHDVRNAIDNMIAEGLIAKEDAERVNAGKVAAFLGNDIAALINKAAKTGRLHKEQPFVMSITPEEAGETLDADEEILVQGIIDLFAEEDDGIILLDYKTDRVMHEEELITRYGKQMELYGIALSKVYGKRVKKYLIYSFTLGKIIDFVPAKRYN